MLEATIRDDAPGWLLVRVDRGLDEPSAANLDFQVTEAVLDLEPVAEGALPFVLVLGRDVALHDDVAPFFHWLANMDPGRDMVLKGNRVGFACAPRPPKTPAATSPFAPGRQCSSWTSTPMAGPRKFDRPRLSPTGDRRRHAQLRTQMSMYALPGLSPMVQLAMPSSVPTRIVSVEPDREMIQS